MDFLVGAFTHSRIYTIRFNPPATPPTQSNPNPKGSLTILHYSQAAGPASWLTLSPQKQHLYATVWSEPTEIAAYALEKDASTSSVKARLLNTKPVRNRSACIAVSNKHVFSAGGPSGEVYRLEDDGSLGQLAQELSFEDMAAAAAKSGTDAHGEFGGIRHGAHSAELAPDGRAFYVADIGRNCIWSFAVDEKGDKEPLKFGQRLISPRSDDGPRHTVPHPNGRVLFSLQEHTSMVDLFAVADDAVSLTHRLQGVKIIPEDKDAHDYWADEVRLGATLLAPKQPRYMFASTRGLKPETKGYVAVFTLNRHGIIFISQALDIYETETSGGWANAVEPAPLIPGHEETEYAAMTDSEQGWVFVLGFAGEKIWEVARVKLGEEGGEIVGAATAVWL